MQKINILSVGKLKEAYFSDAANEYIKRLSAKYQVNEIIIPAAKLPISPNEKQIEEALKKEEEKILKAIKPGKTVAMCIEGKQLSSENFCEVLNTSETINFIIGGSFGLSENVKKCADIMLSFSKMTFPHRLFKIMLLEQIYRSYKITSGGKYHK